MSTPEAPLRIGDVAKLAGTTPRTIRYYEELGLLAGAPERPSGRHRLYSVEDVDRVCEVLRLKRLLGVNLRELKQLLACGGGLDLLERRADELAELRAEMRTTFG